MADSLGALETQIAANESAEDSAVILLNQLSALVAATAGDPAKAAQLAADLKTHADALAAAILQNTPASS